MATRRTHIRLESTSMPAGLDVAELDGVEGISRLYDFTLLVVCPPAESLDIDSVLADPVSLVFELLSGDSFSDGVEQRRLGGVVTEVGEVQVEPYRTYRLRIQPMFSRANYVETLDIFQDLNISGLIQHKLDLLDMSKNVDFRLMENYPEREFVVQYKETDHCFLSRQVEHWGISYFFEHNSGDETVVFTDHNTTFPKTANVRYVDSMGELGVHELETKTKQVPQAFVQRDYNYRQPGSDVTGSSIANFGAGGVIEYGAHIKDREEANRIASIRREESHVDRRVFSGTANCALAAASRTTVTEHPFGDMNLLLTKVRHRYRHQRYEVEGQTSGYESTFVGIEETIPFRPPRLTPKPRVKGMLTGIIESAPGDEYADIDHEGRYRVRFMFDTGDANNAKASRPVRMMQPHSGPGYGMHFPLRKDIEVLITFIDGDPDRPIIAGTVPNPQTASPVIDANRDRNVIRTGGGNEINIDDKDGAQRIKITVPHSNTIFQLGSPNAAERGAMLETQGAMTSTATVGHTTIGSIGATITAFTDFRKAGDIVTNAVKKKGILPWLALGSTLLDIGIGAAEGVYGTIEAIENWENKNAKAETAAAQDKAADAQVACESCRKDLKKMADDLPDLMDDSTNPPTNLKDTVVAKQQALNKSQETVDGLYVRSLQKRRWYDFYAEKNVGLKTDENEAADESLMDKSKADWETSQTDLSEAENTPASDGTSITAVDPKTGADVTPATTVKPLNQATQDRDDAVDAAIAKASGEDKEKYEAYKTKAAACHTKCTTELKKTRTAADEKYVAYRDKRDEQSADEIERKYAKSKLDLFKTAKTITVSTITTLYTFVQWLLSKRTQHLRWKAAKKTSQSDGSPNPTTVITPDSPMHTLGAAHSTEVYGKEGLLMWGKQVTIYGSATRQLPGLGISVPDSNKGKVYITSPELTHLASAGTTQVSALDEIKLQSKKVTILGKDEPRLLAGRWDEPAGTIDATAILDMTLTSQKGNVSVQALEAGKHIAMEAESEIKATTKTATITATEKAVLQTAVGGGNAKLQLDETGKIDAETGDWKISMDKSSGITAGKSEEAELTLTTGTAKLDAKSILSLKTQQASMVTSKWTVSADSQINMTADTVKISAKRYLIG